MPREFSAIAIISAHNEADIIAPVLAHLIREGLSVYLIDHASTDGTARAAEPFLGQGLVAIEPLAADGFTWERILARKVEIATEIDADWFIHHDADEFRESPWEGMRLLDAIARVDRLGYNAIDFDLLNFRPTDDRLTPVVPGADPRQAMRFYERGEVWDKPQIKCWKKRDAPPDLVSSGGHEAIFPGRRVFPLRFILRHYPIRSQAHGRRKVFEERQPRFLAAELARGWHVQYAGLLDPHDFLHDPATLIEFDADAVRLQLLLDHRGVEEAAQALVDQAKVLARAEVRAREEAAALRSECRRLRDDRDRERAQLELVAADRERVLAEARRLGDVGARLVDDTRALQRELDALRGSKSWQLTRPLRALQRLFTRS